MRNVCQFCDKNPGYLQKFARGWSCNNCLYLYGLINHKLLTDEVEIDTEEYIDDEAETMADVYARQMAWGGQHRQQTEWNEYYDDGYSQPYKQGLGYYYKPKKAIVVIEELECDPANLASATHYVRTLANAKKAEVKAGKWTVDIFY
jgi:hypothetical protein